MSSLTVPATKSVCAITSERMIAPLSLAAITGKKYSLEEKVTLLLMRDLVRVGWRLKSAGSKSFELAPPDNYGKQAIKDAMSFSRNEILDRNAKWIKDNIKLGQDYLASGLDVLKSNIVPRIEVCKTQKQNDIFRILRYHWSSSASDYVGRRMRLLIRDDGIEGSPVIGIAAIGSSIIHIPHRDKWIGWDTETRSKRIIYMMDAYVIGAMPPYNYLLGGKLISYILCSNEIRDLYKKKYKNKTTLINKRKASDLVLIMTSSLYGPRSSQYNRLSFGKSLLYKPIGVTSGYGSLHISGETFGAMRELAEIRGCNTSNRFGMGPNWRMRIIRSACDALNLNSDVILQHSFQRGLFAIPLAVNCKSFLRGESDTPIYRNLPLSRLVKHWRTRWLTMRKQNDLVIHKVRSFLPEQFTIKKNNYDSECDK